MKFISLRCLLFGLFFYGLMGTAQADLTWKGLYRAEANYFNSVGMTSGTNKDYFLHHLRLDPKIVLIDGFELHGRLDILNQGEYSVAGSQAGQSFGGSFTPENGSFFGADGSAALTDNQIYKVRDVNLAELYLRFVHVSGELIVGRAPLDFGLGINLNSGHGEFDHWFDNRDMISYKLLFGSITAQPYVARITDGFNSNGDAASEIGALLSFTKPQTGLEIGAMYVGRHTPGRVNVDQLASSGSSDTQRYGLFFKRKHKKVGLTYAFELGFNSGDLGQNASGESIDYSGVGGVLELDYRTPISGLSLGFKTGYASGQDGSKDDSFSSFAFDRNYNLGIMMFNHPLGNPNLDLLGTTPYGKQGPYFGGSYQSQNSIDTESVSNTIFAAPYISYQFGSQWGLKSQWIWAQLDQDIVNSVLYASTNPALEVDKSLGLEWDLTLTYQPFEKVTWNTSLGAFFPGAAFEGGSQNYKTKTVFGGVSGVSIRFD